MRPAKGDPKPPTGELTKVQFELEKKIAEQLVAMERHTKISQSELVMIALKRFISQHKDYFPDDYRG